MKKKLIVILYSEAKREYFLTEEHYITEKEVFDRVKIVKRHIEKLGYEVLLLPGNTESIFKLKDLKPYIVFNLVDSVRGNEELISIIPATLDLLSIPYTGAGVTSLAINGNKYLTKAILRQSNIPVPGFQLFFSEKQKLEKNLRFPLIIKLNESHGSLEINQNSVVENEEQLRGRIKFLIKKYHQSIIVEEYIRGKEITALMIDDNKKKIILAEERIFFKKEKFSLYSYEAAWGEKEIYDCKRYLLNKKLQENIIQAFNILQFKDYARYEFIINSKDEYYFIDANANPAFGPYGTTSGPFGYLLYLNKISFLSVVKKIIKNTLRRFKT